MTFVRTSLSRRATIAGSLSALVAACGLTGCAEEPEPVAEAAPPPHTELQDRLDSGSGLAVAGERLNAALLRRFYAQHDFQPVWPTRQAQADALVKAVLQAGDQGLDPDLFHAALLWRRATLSPLDRDLVVSDAILAYAAALAHGAVPRDRRGDDEVLTPGPVDVVAAVDDAIGSDDPVSVIDALAPQTPTYRALLQALQDVRPHAEAGDKAAMDRLRTIEVNLERQRWLPRPLPADRVWVNVADERLVLYRDDQPVFSTRVVVGQDVEQNQSPEFRATIDASFFNPPWVVPVDIATREIMPKVRKDPDYLTRNNMVLLANGEIEQRPGPDAGLGLIMFDMPNRFEVYLHDTPNREIFNLADRRISHGCIRVQHSFELASLLLQEPIDAIKDAIKRGTAIGTTRHNLPTPVPVFVVYQTAFVGTDGTLQFRPDFYNRDAGIWQKLHSLPQEPVSITQADNRATASGRF